MKKKYSLHCRGDPPDRPYKPFMKQRLIFIDLLRGWATIVMIEVHVFNAFIIPAYKEASWFGVLNYINGLVAPSFIFIAGFIFVIISQRKLEEFRLYGAAFWKQLRRIGLIWSIGYLLHLPYFSFRRTLNESTQVEWLKFYQSDVLHCIALGLLILFVARLIILSDKTYRSFLMGFGLFIICFAPFVWDIDVYGFIPAPLAAYISGEHYSQFPIFPWLGFMMFGGYCAQKFLEAKQSGREQRFIKKFAVIGVLCTIGGAAVMEIPVHVPLASLDVRPNTLFFIERFGIVMVLLSLCWWYEDRRKTEKSFVLDVSRESLFVYAGHLLVIYGMFFRDRSLSFMFGGTLGVVECVLATLALIVTMIVSAKLWGWLKRRHVPLARGISFATVFLFSYLYFTR
ncbi:MAG: DUF1624 domain-containing protein [Ignavibacteriales bacterium]|nr:DUF1624 domain-containing protein [Ignavibacteriales bacterium]